MSLFDWIFDWIFGWKIWLGNLAGKFGWEIWLGNLAGKKWRCYLQAPPRSALIALRSSL
jgi:hypothetical protein